MLLMLLSCSPCCYSIIRCRIRLTFDENFESCQSSTQQPWTHSLAPELKSGTGFSCCFNLFTIGIRFLRRVLRKNENGCSIKYLQYFFLFPSISKSFSYLGMKNFVALACCASINPSERSKGRQPVGREKKVNYSIMHRIYAMFFAYRNSIASSAAQFTPIILFYKIC